MRVAALAAFFVRAVRACSVRWEGSTRLPIGAGRVAERFLPPPALGERFLAAVALRRVPMGGAPGPARRVGCAARVGSCHDTEVRSGG